MKQKLLGKIFISHSSADKRFVRSLADRITAAGFDVWLDERELRAGDSLPTEVSSALESAQVVIVVVSKASSRSRWLRFELSKATAQMIAGKCRVIPVVRDQSYLPPEVSDLLYADFSKKFASGMRSVLSALHHEASRASLSSVLSFSQQTDLLLDEVFGSRALGWIEGEYKQKDFESVFLPVPDDQNDETSVTFEKVTDYLQKAEPLTPGWWSEFIDTTRELPDTFFLVLSERPLGSALEQVHPHDASIRYTERTISEIGLPYLTVVGVDLSLPDAPTRRSRLAQARELLISLARRRNAHVAELRAQRTRPGA